MKIAYTDTYTEDRLVKATFAEHLETELGWVSIFTWNEETFGPGSTLSRKDTGEVVLARDLQCAIQRMNPELPPAAVEEAIAGLSLHSAVCSKTHGFLSEHMVRIMGSTSNAILLGDLEQESNRSEQLY